MKHTSEHYRNEGIEEWLIYFSWKETTFDISFESDEHTLRGRGTYAFMKAADRDIHLKGLGKKVEVKLEAIASAPWYKRLFGTATLHGKLRVDGQEVGDCLAGNSYSEKTALMKITSAPLGWSITVRRSNPQQVICPLIVDGIRDCEMVLEDYFGLEERVRSTLPGTPNPKYFVGSCRPLRYSDKPFDGVLEAMGLVVTVTELLIRPNYMDPRNI